MINFAAPSFCRSEADSVVAGRSSLPVAADSAAASHNKGQDRPTCSAWAFWRAGQLDPCCGAISLCPAPGSPACRCANAGESLGRRGTCLGLDSHRIDTPIIASDITSTVRTETRSPSIPVALWPSTIHPQRTLGDIFLTPSAGRDAGSPIIRSQLPMLTPVWRRADYPFGGGRTSVGAARRCGLPALCAASGL